jgi:hypothetical protein
MSQELAEEILRRIREKVAEGKRPRVPKAFRPPAFEDFVPDMQILAFDQSLANCGWALLNTEKKITVVDSGTIRPPALGTVSKGFEMTFAKAIGIASEVRTLVGSLEGGFEQVVLELPAVVGYRTESSLAAAVAICIELDRRRLPTPDFVSRQAAGSVLCGDRHASKNISSELVNNLVVDHPTGTGQWTEHVRDAVFVGLKYLYLEEK